MSDLISRCKLFNQLATVQTLAEAYAVIQGMEPEKDAEYVVRCGQCEHMKTRMPQNTIYCDLHVEFVGPNDFCSEGERKEGKQA